MCLVSSASCLGETSQTLQVYASWAARGPDIDARLSACGIPYHTCACTHKLAFPRPPGPQPECLCSDIHGKWKQATPGDGNETGRGTGAPHGDDDVREDGADGPLDVIAYEDDEFESVAAADQSSVDDSQDDEPGSDLRHSLERARASGKGDGVPTALERPVDLNYVYDDDTGALTVTNNPLADPEIVSVVSLGFLYLSLSVPSPPIPFFVLFHFLILILILILSVPPPPPLPPSLLPPAPTPSLATRVRERLSLLKGNEWKTVQQT